MTGERCAYLLRAVNVSGRNRVPMAELRALLSAEMDLGEVATFIASGNVIADATADPAAVCAEMRALIVTGFGVDTPVIARTGRALADALDGNPFPDAAQDKLLHVMFLEDHPVPGAVDALRERLVPGERVELRGADLWIDYAPGGVHSTKLTRAVLDRCLGVAGTARNVRTVRTLAELTA